jgi:hypothetical protein
MIEVEKEEEIDKKPYTVDKKIYTLNGVGERTGKVTEGWRRRQIAELQYKEKEKEGNGIGIQEEETNKNRNT